MTLIVGALCKRGVVIGADSSATFTAGPFRVMEQPCEKIQIIEQSVIVACTGSIGFSQRFCNIVKEAWKEQAFKKTAENLTIAKKLCAKFLADLDSTKFKLGPDPYHQFGALVAFPAENGPNLCEFGVLDFQPELKNEQIWFCSMGSGQPISDPFLALTREIFWQSTLPSLNDGVFIVYWALQHAIQINPGGINWPIRIAVLDGDADNKLSAKILDEKELLDHQEMIEATKKLLRTFREDYAQGKIGVPEIPKP